MKLKRTILAGAFALMAGAAIAAGAYTNGFPVATVPLTGNELIPADTQLPNGVYPQTEAISVSTLKNYMFGNTASGTASATAGAATLNAGRGVVTSEALTTAAGAVYTLTLTNSTIAATSIVQATAQFGTSTTGQPVVATATPAAGSVVFKVQNISGAAALNGTIKVAFTVLN